MYSLIDYMNPWQLQLKVYTIKKGDHMAYSFYLGDTLLPVSPSKLTTSIKNKNKTVDLINLSEINILKAPGLTEVKFDALLPNVEYPFATYNGGFKSAKSYLDVFESLKANKSPFQFIVSRSLPSGAVLSYTNMTVSLESYDIKESAGEGFDIVVSISLKQYKSYGGKTAQVKSSNSGTATATVSTSQERTSKSSAKSYTVKSGDTLSNIAKKSYGKSTNWKQIYTANKTVIESTAKKHGKTSSSNGWWIYPGTKLSIP